MNKINKNKIVLIFITLVILLLGIFVFSNSKKIENNTNTKESVLENNIENAEQNTKKEVSTPGVDTENTLENKQNPKSTPGVDTMGTVDTVDVITIPSVGSVDLIAGNLNIKLDIKEGETFYDVLVRGEDAGKIKFDGKKYTGLGFFVTSIGDLHSKDGGYLIYYINGKEASVGVSSYIPKDKDFIEWKLE